MSCGWKDLQRWNQRGMPLAIGFVSYFHLDLTSSCDSCALDQTLRPHQQSNDNRGNRVPIPCYEAQKMCLFPTFNLCRPWTSASHFKLRYNPFKKESLIFPVDTKWKQLQSKSPLGPFVFEDSCQQRLCSGKSFDRERDTNNNSQVFPSTAFTIPFPKIYSSYQTMYPWLVTLVGFKKRSANITYCYEDDPGKENNFVLRLLWEMWKSLVNSP